ncbi:flagellar biosynthesis protein [Paenibacillus swuensis]|uniref:Flagellar biosynthesis protein n=1 Tax=Paenibacillus swuensis TaxID=1178515 RepID=A0A172TL92_9BACL|nr:TIGR02530 family flagellar biosynthesis protein [Paenibacillus swuensis]ANE47543.1 flagellar biosynthesis protein [Paenibacillus swuensis]
MSDRITIGRMFPNAVVPGAKNIQVQQGSKSFHEIFQNQFVRFSHHAESRLHQRGIELKPEQITKISTALDKAAAKGAKDSLFLMNDMAFIVNVKNRTVVTAMDQNALKDNVFTQIDSAIVIS